MLNNFEKTEQIDTTITNEQRRKRAQRKQHEEK